MGTGKVPPMTRHRVRWGQHGPILEQWRRQPPTHPVNPRYRCASIQIDGRYSLFETIVNYFRDRGWLDAPPADFKWAVLTVYYAPPEDPMDRFASL